MKHIILGDLHFGVKGFDLDFFKNQKIFFTEQLIPFMKENNIKNILQLGDIFENRKNIDIVLFSKVVELFELLKENNIEFNCLIGNHDIPFKDSYKDSLLYQLEKMNLIKIYDGEFNDNIYMKSWILPNEKFNPNNIKQDIILGHFEISGFEMTRGQKYNGELKPEDFKNKLVLSGHFHLKSNYQINENYIIYVGTPYQLNWNDFKDIKGFYVLDDTTKELDFFENIVSKKFVKVHYYKDKIIIEIEDGNYLIINENELYNYKDVFLNSFLKIYVYDENFETFLNFFKDNNIKFSFFNNIQLKTEIKEIKIDNDNKTTLLNYIKDTELPNKERIVEKINELLKKIENNS